MDIFIFLLRIKFYKYMRNAEFATCHEDGENATLFPNPAGSVHGLVYFVPKPLDHG